MGFLSTRRREAEWIDEPGADPVAIRKSLDFIRFVNRILGYSRVMVRELERFSIRWKPGQMIRILDIGTGSADIPENILKWARLHQFDVRIVGLDLSAQIVTIARESTIESKLRLVRGDALSLPFADESFDYAITSMFLHHLGDADAETALAEMNRVSRRGVIASDLLRVRKGYAFIWFFTLLAIPMVRHDARVSVAQAFSMREIVAMRDRAGLGFAKCFKHLSHRFVLSGEKPW